jgi:hypothetical protein
VKTLVCPHCQTQVSDRASVCAGCGAEIVRGATRKERSRIGAMFALAALLIGLIAMGASRLPKTNSNEALFVVLGLCAFPVVGYFLGKGIAGLRRRSQLRFFRSYQHQ